MHQMVLLVLNNVEQCNPVLKAWEDAGVGGATIIHTTGMGRLKRASLRDDFPLMPSLADFLGDAEVQHRTVFTIIDDDSLVDKIVAATEKVTGDLNNPHTGMLVVLPVTRVIGMHRQS